MKLIFCSTIFLAGLVSAVVHAAPPHQFNYAKLNLIGIEVVDVDGIDTFGQKLKRVASIPPGLKSELEIGSRSKIVSPLYELTKRAVGEYYQNVYVYVGRAPGNKFEFVQAIVTNSGTIFTMDIEMTDVRRNEMTLIRGPATQRRTLTVTSKTNALFP